MTGVGVAVRTTEKVGTAQANGDTNVRTNRIDAARGSSGMLVDGARGARALRKPGSAGVASRLVRYALDRAALEAATRDAKRALACAAS